MPTERLSPSKALKVARQTLVAELDVAQQKKAHCDTQADTHHREAAKWITRIDALQFALDALPPMPVRGRPAANGGAGKPKRVRKKPAAPVAPPELPLGK